MAYIILLTKTVQVVLERYFETTYSSEGISLQQKTWDLFASIVPKSLQSSFCTIVWHLLPYTIILSYLEQNYKSPALSKAVQNYFKITPINSRTSWAVCGLVYLIAVGFFKISFDGIHYGLQQLFLPLYKDYLYDLEQIFPPQFRVTDIAFAFAGGDFYKNFRDLVSCLFLWLPRTTPRPHLGNSRPYREWKQTYRKYPDYQQFLKASSLKDLLCPNTEDLIILPVRTPNETKSYEQWPRTFQITQACFDKDRIDIEFLNQNLGQDGNYFSRLTTALNELNTANLDLEFKNGIIAYLEELCLVNSIPQQDPLQTLIPNLKKEEENDNPKDVGAPLIL